MITDSFGTYISVMEHKKKSKNKEYNFRNLSVERAEMKQRVFLLRQAKSCGEEKARELK